MIPTHTDATLKSQKAVRSFMKLLLAVLMSAVVLSSMAACDRSEVEPVQMHLIPQPSNLNWTGGQTLFEEGVVLKIESVTQKGKTIGAHLQDYFTTYYPHIPIHWIQSKTDDHKANFRFILDENLRDGRLGNEGYLLRIDADGVVLKSGTENGLFLGMQTLKQLMPRLGSSNLVLPWCEAEDIPEYAHRGAMVDVARHFFEINDLKALVDVMALYKFNVLHLHLSDDQGWRLEIKSWPKLTELGSITEVGGTPGGFYSQEEFIDLVEYAQDRFIEIIPEFDMPGHTNAVLSSYSELNCDGKIRSPYTGIDVGFSSLCTDKLVTYQFVDDVVREVSELIPGAYLHMGGDESDATPHDGFIYFVDSVAQIVRSHGKQMIGWNEVANAHLDSSSVVQFWNNSEKAASEAIHAVEQGCQLIMSPADRIYLDMKYDSTTALGLNWAGYSSVQHAYEWEPTEYLPGVGKVHILGVESPVWTETLTNTEELYTMMFPRLLGVAELGWTPRPLRNWVDYRRRLAYHGLRMQDLGVNFYKSPEIDWE